MSFLISSVRRQLIAAFVAVSLVFAIALVIGWSSIGSVNAKVQSGAKQLPVLEGATGRARDMVASELSTVLQPSNAEDHLGDVQTFEQTVQQLRAYAMTPAARQAMTALQAAFTAWQGLDNQILGEVKAHHIAAAAKLANGAANTAADNLTAAVQHQPGELDRLELEDADAGDRADRSADRRVHRPRDLARPQSPHRQGAGRHRQPRRTLHDRTRRSADGDGPR
jgi:hypothetical protein